MVHYHVQHPCDLCLLEDDTLGGVGRGGEGTLGGVGRGGEGTLGGRGGSG